MKTEKINLVKNGVVVNTIVATLEEARKSFPDHECIASEKGGKGWEYKNKKLVKPKEKKLSDALIDLNERLSESEKLKLIDFVSNLD